MTNQEPSKQGRSSKTLALLLALLAGGFYVAFILVQFFRSQS